jgi:hypothetical protein
LSSDTYGYINAAFSTANTGTASGSYANSAFAAANTAGVYGNSAFTTANTAGVYGNSAFTTANSAGVYANSAFAKANTGGLALTDDTTTNATRYPLLSTATSGTLATGNTSSSKLTYNPSTGLLSATGLASSGNTQANSLGVGTAASGTAGEIRATNNITAFYSSDRQFKENVETIPNALDSVNAIGGKLFDWTDAYLEAHGGTDDYFIRKADFGVIAQDVQAVFPRAVRTRPDGSLAVDYEKLVALAFAAIVELRAEVKELKKG